MVCHDRVRDQFAEVYDTKEKFEVFAGPPGYVWHVCGSLNAAPRGAVPVQLVIDRNSVVVMGCEVVMISFEKRKRCHCKTKLGVQGEAEMIPIRS